MSAAILLTTTLTIGPLWQEAPLPGECATVDVLDVTSAELSIDRANAIDGVTVVARGPASLLGSRSPALVIAGLPEGGVVTLNFVTCNGPGGSIAPVEATATFYLVPVPRQIVVRASRNTVTLDVKMQ